MANIRVDSAIAIYDGLAVTFRSPVDCSTITGLKVYYPGADGAETSQEFVFADAHNNELTDVADLFKEDVIVKVVLDTVNSKAFVQNADTNAYLEGRFDGKANIPTYTLYTLLSTAWAEDSTYSLEEDYPSEEYDIEINLSENVTPEQLQAFGGAGIVGNSTTNIIKALNAIPGIDIEVIIKAVKK